MRLRKYLSTLSLAAVLCGSPVLADENKADPINSDDVLEGTQLGIVIDVPTEHPTPNEGFEFAAVDFCYVGTFVDPDTGEVMDVLGLCSEDAIEGNLDLA